MHHHRRRCRIRLQIFLKCKSIMICFVLCVFKLDLPLEPVNRTWSVLHRMTRIGQPVCQMLGGSSAIVRVIHRRLDRFCGRVGGGGRYLERDKTYSFTFSFIQRLLHSVTISYKGLYNVRIEEGRQKNRYFERRGVPLFLK